MATKQKTKAPATKQEVKENQTGFDVRIDRLVQREETSVKAVASVAIGGFSVHGFKVVDSPKGLFVAMPSNSYKDGKGETQYNEIFHPITKESREELIQKIKTAYEQALEENQTQSEEEEESEGMEEEPAQVGPVM